MGTSRVVALIRSVVVGAALVAAAATLWHATGDDRAAALAPRPGLDALVAAGAGVVLALALVWAAVLVVAVGATPLVGPRTGGALVARLGCPPALHRLLALACGVAVAGSIAGAATANAAVVHHGPADPRDGGTSVLARLDGLPLPDRPVGSDRAVRQADEQVVVPGDCLWRIARARLGTHATNAEIDRAWQAIYRANRARIGADPDLILPGQRLDVPAAVSHHPAGPSGALEEER